MVDHCMAKMYLSGERSIIETEHFRSCQTFAFADFQHKQKTVFGCLYMLNDETLAAGKSCLQATMEDTIIILLPLVGTILYVDDSGKELYIQPGEAQIAEAANSFQVFNPYQDGLVNYLQLSMRKTDPIKPDAVLRLFDISCNKNSFTQIYTTPGQALDTGDFFKVSIGMFAGRQEIIYRSTLAGNGVFAFVIQGAFEVQNRLVEARDGIALWNLPELEAESLSNDAIMLLIEFPVPLASFSTVTK